MQAYPVKAAREGKGQTSWLDPNVRYEEGLTSFIEHLLDRGCSARFLAALEPFARRVALLGALNSLSALALKLTIPGVPDIYQGCELWDLSLVDPDNRRPVDFAARAAALATIGKVAGWHGRVESWPDGRIKLALTHALLSLRQRFPDLFTQGDYRAVEVIGPQREEVVAFARTGGRNAIIVAVGRLFARAAEGGTRWPAGAAWNATLNLEGYSHARNLLGACAILDGRQWPVRDLFDPIPVAVIKARSEVVYQRHKRRRRDAIPVQESLPAAAS